jgi:4-hydroxyphenylpyruvate dioxygenase-like putative hemolysin
MRRSSPASPRGRCEFIQQDDDTPSVYKEFLARRPHGGLHHLAYDCANLDDAVRQASAEKGVWFELFMRKYLI